MNNKLLSYTQLHIAVILYGLTAILGDLISISAVSLVWWRVMITSISLLAFVGFGRHILRLHKKQVLIYIGIGVLVGLHWICFYGSVKLANASIALITMATTSFFTSIIEPIVTGSPFNKMELILGLLIIPAMILVANNIDWSMMTGFFIGLLSALLASLFASFNKKYVDNASPYVISFLEMFGAFVFISLIIPFVIRNQVSFMPIGSDWLYLIILSLFCTTLAFVITMMALKHVSAFDSNLVINLEPVYGIILAILILKEHEQLSLSFYIGVILILCIVFSHPIIVKKLNARKKLA